MELIHFENDYSDGAHPEVLRRLVETNGESTAVYSEDIYCQEAARRILALCQNDHAAVHFLPGGTITNTVLIASALLPYQGVVSSAVGHIHVHETGAVEARGHKVLTLPSKDGKIAAEEIHSLYRAHTDDPNREHTVMPGMVYLTDPTEYGALYTRSELAAIRDVCRRCGLYLYIDGARLGYALTAEKNDLTLPDLAELADAFSIGGTKQGALLGEALVITHDALKKNFRYAMKQSGALLAKGRILGVQFLALFENNLYFRTSAEANRKAARIAEELAALGYSFLVPPATNQLFPVFSGRELAELSKKYSFCPMGRVGDDAFCVRICTNWATRDKDVNALLNDIAALRS